MTSTASGRLPASTGQVSSGPLLLDLSDHRAAQKIRFGGEFLPDVTEAASGRQFAAFFQSNRDGTAKGIVMIDPTKESWT